MYGYIYKTTNLVNNKIYIGQKHSDKFLGNRYLGLGKRLREAVNKYGKECFMVELLEEVDSLEKKWMNVKYIGFLIITPRTKT